MWRGGCGCGEVGVGRWGGGCGEVGVGVEKSAWGGR